MQIQASDISTQTLSITDYQMVSTKVARVICAFTGNHNRDSLTAALQAKLKHAAAPVENSFRIIRAGVAVGYLRANKEVRLVSKQELNAGYKIMASNIMMDAKDETLWELKKGAGGAYLARHGNEDLSELVEATVSRRSDIPALRHLAQASVAKRELVAFVTTAGDMDYGFCVGVNNAKGRLRVVSRSSRQAVVVPHEAVASVTPFNALTNRIPRELHEKIMASGIDRSAIDQEIAYYTRLYSYSPEYLDKVIEQIEGTATI